MIKLTAPAKTFIFGEYIALIDGPTLIATTEPFFELRIEDSLDEALIHIHPDSPAGQFYQSEKKYFVSKKIEFCDPYEGCGGYGASSAQFLLLYEYRYGKTDWKTLRDCYQGFAWNGKGIKPSGADVIAQVTGGITEFCADTQVLKKHMWPFKEAVFSIVHTQKKLATHEHLQTLCASEDKHFLALDDLSDLIQIAAQGIHAFKQQDLDAFIHAINAYQTALEQHGWLAPHSAQLLSEYRAQPHVLAAKACGAMGADTLFLVQTPL